MHLDTRAVLHPIFLPSLHIHPLSRNFFGTSTYLLLKYSAIPFPRPSILSEDAIPPFKLSNIRLWRC